MRTLLLVLLLASPAWAQPSLYPKGCTVETVGDEIRARCGDEGIGIKGEGRGQREVRRGRSWKTLGIKAWQVGKVIEPPAPEGDPLVPDVTGIAGVASAVPTLLADGAPLVDWGCFWTPRAEVLQGGAAAMTALCALANALANEAYTLSNVPGRTRLRLAQRIEYVEGVPGTDLGRLPTKTDGHLDTVHALRDAYGLDLVTLIGEGWAAQGLCGLGYFIEPAQWSVDYGFNIVDRRCANSLTPAHENGHNMGLAHDPANAQCPSQPCPGYWYGHYDLAANFKTVMSYGGLPRITRFSTPLLTYNGAPLGIADQRDNVRRLLITMPNASAYKAAVPTSRQPSRPVRARVEPHL